MAHEVAETSRNYSASPKHMSLIGGDFGKERRRAQSPPLTPDRSGRQARGRKLSASSHVQLAGRPRVIIEHTGSSLAVRNP